MSVEKEEKEEKEEKKEVKKILKTTVSELYAKKDAGSYTFTDYRPDLSQNISNRSDDLIEHGDIHIPNPFEFTVKDVVDWSMKNFDNSSIVMDEVKVYHDIISEKNKTYDAEYMQFYNSENDLDELPVDVSEMSKTDKTRIIVDHCKNRLENLRTNYSGDIDEDSEIDTRRENLYKIRLNNTNNNLLDAQTKLYTSRFALTNEVTILDDIYENGSKDKPYAKKYRKYSIGEVIEMNADPKTNEVDKANRKVVFSNTSGDRPIGEQYHDWSGLQIFDIDLKFSPVFNKFEDKFKKASEIRDVLFQHMKKYPWLVSIQLSSSGKSLHIYTKVSRMHHLFKFDEKTDPKNIHNNENAKFWYRMSYYQKYCVIAFLLNSKFDIDVTKPMMGARNRKNFVIDGAMAKVQQGIFLNHDPNAKLNNSFYDLYPVLYYHVPPEDDLETTAWILNPKYLSQFESWWYDSTKMNDVALGNKPETTLNLDYTLGDIPVLDTVQQFEINSMSKGEKYNIRWRVCNTVIDVFGDTENARAIAHHVLRTKESSTDNQIDAFLRSSVLHDKKADKYTIKQLSQLGFSIELTEESKEQVKIEELDRIKYSLEHSNYLFDMPQPTTVAKLLDGEYLWHKKDEILGALKNDKVNVIESAPGTGKTELFKRLSNKYSICLVLPFTSTIEAKIETDPDIAANYEVYYGNKSIRDIRGDRDKTRKMSAVMTIDKFSKIKKSDYRLFDYIVIDESHLLFTSSYRLAVVGKATDNIRSYAEDVLVQQEKLNFSDSSIDFLQSGFHSMVEDILPTSTKLIMMSGTIIGEVKYFSHYGLLNYIKVIKKHPHKKKAKLILTQNNDTKKVVIYEMIANAIKEGKTVIHPTNLGDAYVIDVAACVEHELGKSINWEYYKKANSDENFVMQLNKNETTKDLDLLFCTDFLSVGIDINDNKEFLIVYDSGFTAEDIEQFNNRVRRSDINACIIYTVLDDDGNMRGDLFRTDLIDLTRTVEIQHTLHDDKLLSEIRYEIKTSPKFFSFLGRMLSKYYVVSDNGRIENIKAAFELDQFETQYKSIASGLLYVKSSLEKKFGYELTFEYAENKSLAIIDDYKKIASNAKSAHKLQKALSFVEVCEFASREDNIEIIRSGEYVLVKDTDGFFDRQNEKPEDHDDVEERSLLFTFEIDQGKHNLTYGIKHKFSIDKALKFVLYMSKYYSPETLLKIIKDYSNESGLINFTELERYEKLVTFVSFKKSDLLAPIIKDSMKVLNENIDQDGKEHKMETIDFDIMCMDIQEKFRTFIKESTTEGEMLKSSHIIRLMDSNVDEDFIKVFIKSRRRREETSVCYREIFNFDSSTSMNNENCNEIFKRLFKPDSIKEGSVAPRHLQKLPNDVRVEIGGKLCKMRKANGHDDISSFTKEYGIQNGQYRKIEKGENYQFKGLLKILGVYQISLQQFFSNPKPKLLYYPRKDAFLYKDINTLDPRFKEIGVKLMKMRKATPFKNYKLFAKEAGVSESQYHKMELGEVDFKIEALIKVLGVHEDSLNQFFINLEIPECVEI